MLKLIYRSDVNKFNKEGYVFTKNITINIDMYVFFYYLTLICLTSDTYYKFFNEGEILSEKHLQEICRYHVSFNNNFIDNYYDKY